jgi:amino acid adenylation domain-containing protein
MTTEGVNYNLGHLFGRIASNFKDKIALRYPDNSLLTFYELNTLSNKIANYLINIGVREKEVVIILNNQSNEAYALMIACLKIGAIYSNIDPKSPFLRFNKMVDVCNPKAIFYFNDQQLFTPESNFDVKTIQIINFESQQFKATLDTLSGDIPNGINKITGNNPAYIMFTSGSTGFPKGAVITHSNVINFINWAKQTYTIVQDDVFTNINPMHFDNSVFDFYASLFNGASLIPVNDNLTRNPRALIEVLNKLSPTIWFSVPSMLVFMLNMKALRDHDLMSLRIVTFGGEGFPKNQLRILWEKWSNRVTFVNVYGPTECTCICSSYVVTHDDIEDDKLLPLGAIANNFFALVLSKDGKIADQGEVGELIIGGPNVGLGYYNNLNKTQEVFINNPLIASHRDIVYKSGDLVTYDSEKDLYHFVGRTDNQIKRMGYRIELEEIENALNSLPSISESAVIYVNTIKYKEKIIAYINMEIDNEIEIKNHLRQLLPSYMIPDKIMFSSEIPKNQNGKIDRLKLKKEWEI